MKLKTTSFFLAIFMSFGVSYAQVNLIKGGDFEDPGIQTFSYESHTCPVYLPGWDFTPGKTLDNLDPLTFNNANVNPWNVRLEMLYVEAPLDNNYQHIRVQRYEWNGWWADQGLTQTVKVQSNQSYTLSFDCRINPGAIADTLFREVNGFASIETPTFLIYRIKNMPDSIITLKAMDIKRWDKTNLNRNWERKAFTYTTPNNVDSLTILLAIRGGKVVSWGGNINMWMDIDNISLVKAGINAVENTRESNVKYLVHNNTVILSGLSGQNNIRVYSAGGSCIKSLQTSSESVNIPIQGKGAYILRIGEKSLKIIL